MKKRMKTLTAIGISCAMCAALLGVVGCGAKSEKPEQAEYAATASENSGSDVAAYADIANMDLDFTERDMLGTWDESKMRKVALEGDGTTITSEGVFMLSGEISNGQLVVDAGDNDKIQLVLDGVKIHNEEGPAILIKNADKCFITLAPNTQNELSDGSSYTLEDDEDEPNATLFSKDDLTINGTGTLAVTGNYRHAISSKDDLVIASGTFNVKSAEDGLRGKDCVKIAGGSFDIEVGEDAIQSSRDDDPTRGFVLINGGEFNISAGNDGIHGEIALIVNGGSIDIAKCEEGLEAMVVNINGGDINVTASDDAINASAAGPSTPNAPDPGIIRNGSKPSEEMQPGQMRSDSQERVFNQDDNSCKIEINGGIINISAKGDAIDSNGTIEINGGTLFASGPESGDNSVLDFEISANINGGNVLMTGPAGMAQDFSGGTQPFIFIQANGKAGQKVSIEDPSGQELLSYTPSSEFQIIQASCPQLKENENYRIVIDGNVIAGCEASCTPSEKGFGFANRNQFGMADRPDPTEGKDLQDRNGRPDKPREEKGRPIVRPDENGRPGDYNPDNAKVR